jgi:hypothetical protein
VAFQASHSSTTTSKKEMALAQEMARSRAARAREGDLILVKGGSRLATEKSFVLLSLLLLNSELRKKRFQF